MVRIFLLLCSIRDLFDKSSLKINRRTDSLQITSHTARKINNMTGGTSNDQGRSEGVFAPPTFLELTYSENRVGHSENYGNNSITKF
jgi:hypothetical protein